LEPGVFAFALWLGLYLVGRNPRDRRLLLAGAGLVAYAIALALDLLSTYAPHASLALDLLRWQRLFLFLPALCWLGLLIVLIAGDGRWHARLQHHPRPAAVILGSTIFFALGTSLLLFPISWLPHSLVVLAIGIDLLLLGVAIAVLDAFDEGETLLPHFLRSLLAAGFLTLLFAGQIVVAMQLSGGITFIWLLLLLCVVSAAIAIQTFAWVFQTLLDRLAFFNDAQLQKTQDRLRQNVEANLRANQSFDPKQADEEEFARLTRRALSHLDNLPRLAASPLTRLPLVDGRLAAAQSVTAGPLERAAVLRSLLVESVERLKPEGATAFGTTGSWRHYNALYYPYVLGLKLYSRRSVQDSLDGTAQAAIAWFAAQVPQRTLHNWQNEAAHLIARDLRTRTQTAPLSPGATSTLNR
jgi:hypothetical protein